MKELKKAVTSLIKSKFNQKLNVTNSIKQEKSELSVEINNSIMRGELLRYSTFVPSVKFNLKSLKESNPKYLELAVKMIETSIKPLNGIDLEVPLNILLNQFKEASYDNQEALDFSWELINQADTLTSKYYLSALAAGPISNKDLKVQFTATIPFIKYILPSYSQNNDLSEQKKFLKAISILINEKADAKKIKLLPKIKYVIDNITKTEHIIDIVKIIYSKTPVDVIINNINSLTKEKLTKDFDFSDYLIKNSL